MIKKYFAAFAGIILSAALFAGCSKAKADVEIANFTPPQKGEKIGVITVKDFGTIKVKLFPEYAPKGVENFEGLADMNYYDELIFHRVIKNFMIQGGDPKGNGTGGNSIWGKEFDLEPSEHLYHFTGAVAYAHAASGGNGSQFYIVSSLDSPLTDEGINDILKQKGTTLPKNVIEKYKEVGGQPYLDGDYTVFGQVFEGQDVVDKIAKVETDENDKPTNQVMIQSIKIVDYEG
jgi:cyclophilin family peptidyl-prolyl cis-trans isomerase